MAHYPTNHKRMVEVERRNPYTGTTYTTTVERWKVSDTLLASKVYRLADRLDRLATEYRREFPRSSVCLRWEEAVERAFAATTPTNMHTRDGAFAIDHVAKLVADEIGRKRGIKIDVYGKRLPDPPAPPAPEQPDARPGNYYVSVRRDSGDARMLLGPFPSHTEALAKVEHGRLLAEKVDQRAPWYAYGTCRSESDLGPGIFNEVTA